MNDITVANLSALESALVFDVRESDEYSAGHVPGARTLPLSELQARVAEVPTGEPVYIICESGGRSARASEFLEASGVDAINVLGGTSAWRLSGYPLSTDAA
jgi:rhodanese-related sulfurtransferase